MSRKPRVKRRWGSGWEFREKNKDANGCHYVERTKPAPNVQSGPELGAFTFDEWKAAGFWVSKGAKSRSRNADGVAIFGIDQVWTKDKKARPPSSKKSSKSVSTSCPKPIKKPFWPQRSALVDEVLVRIEQKNEEAEAIHMHMPETFEADEDDEDYIPY